VTTTQQESASTVVLETDAGEALVLVALLATLARANDDVIELGASDTLTAACAITRVRPRRSDMERVFDAIGEHTRALVVRDPEPELLEALTALGPPVIALASEALASPGVTVRLVGEGRTRLWLIGQRESTCEAVERALSLLAGDARRLAS
jgi:hypothetical protein